MKCILDLITTLDSSFHSKKTKMFWELYDGSEGSLTTGLLLYMSLSGILNNTAQCSQAKTAGSFQTIWLISLKMLLQVNN